MSYGTQSAKEADGRRKRREKEREGVHGSRARVESDSRNESGAKDRVDSPEQVAGDLERQGEEGVRELDSDARAGGGDRGGGLQPDFRLHASSAYFKSP